MAQRNTKAHASAINAATAKSATIKKYGIHAELTVDEQDSIVQKMVVAKAESTGAEPDDAMTSGQEFYLGLLMDYSTMETAKERYEFEYSRSFREFSTEEEGIDIIADCM